MRRQAPGRKEEKKKGRSPCGSGPSLGRKRPRRATVNESELSLPHCSNIHRAAQNASGIDLFTPGFPVRIALERGRSLTRNLSVCRSATNDSFIPKAYRSGSGLAQKFVMSRPLSADESYLFCMAISGRSLPGGHRRFAVSSPFRYSIRKAEALS